MRNIVRSEKMRRSTDLRSTFVRGVILYVVASAQAHAYVDPGSGIMLWQGLLAAAGAAIAFIRNPIDMAKRVADWVRHK